MQGSSQASGTAHAAWQALKDNAGYLQNSIDSSALRVELVSNGCLSNRQRASLEAVSDSYLQSERLIGVLMENIAERNDASILDRTIEVMLNTRQTIPAHKLGDSYTEHKRHPSWLNTSWPPGASAAVPSAQPQPQPQPQPIENLTGTARAACKALREKAFYLQMSLDSQSFLGFLHTRDCISFLQKSTLEAESNIYKQSQMLVERLINNITDQNDASILVRIIEVMRNSGQVAEADNLMQHYSACLRSVPQSAAGRVDDGRQVERAGDNVQNSGRYFRHYSPFLGKLMEAGFINMNQWSHITSSGVGEEQLSILLEALLENIRENPSPEFLGSLTGRLNGKVPSEFLSSLLSMNANQQASAPLRQAPAVVQPPAQPQPQPQPQPTLQGHIINTDYDPDTGQRVPGSHAGTAGFSSAMVLNPSLQQAYAPASRPAVGGERYMITERDISRGGGGNPASTAWKKVCGTFTSTLVREERSSPGTFQQLVANLHAIGLLTESQRTALLAKTTIYTQAEALFGGLQRSLNGCSSRLVEIQALLPDSLQRELGQSFFEALGQR